MEVIRVLSFSTTVVTVSSTCKRRRQAFPHSSSFPMGADKYQTQISCELRFRVVALYRCPLPFGVHQRKTTKKQFQHHKEECERNITFARHKKQKAA
jgi:hypothetical protein